MITLIITMLIIVLGIIAGIILFLTRNKDNISIPYTDNLNKSIKSNMILPNKTFYPKKIEAVMVCAGYSDFLSWTIPYNRQHFDKLVVVSTLDDLETQAICSFWNVECVTTNVFYENGDKFNKGKGINYGLEHLSKDDWVVHLDADIFLPPKTREILDLLDLDKETLYSIDRLNCNSFTDWIKYLENPENQHSNTGLLTQDSFSNGARLLNLDRDGYVGIGYFQLFNPKESGIYKYSDQHGKADRSDVLFSYNWDRKHRQLIPELLGIHLQSQEGNMGINWLGRKSAKFTLNKYLGD